MTGLFAYERAFKNVFPRVRAHARRLHRERLAAPSLLASLEPHPRARQLLMVRNSERYRTVGLCKLLLDTGWEARLDEPARTLDLAEVAVVVADLLLHEDYGFGVVEDLRVRAWAHLGNARRLHSDAGGAEQAFAEAERWLAAGGVRPAEEARLASFRASLDIERRCLGDADRQLDRAIELYRSERLFHEMGLVLVNKGSVCGYQGDAENQIRFLRRSLHLIDPARDPRVVVAAVHNLVYILHHEGDSLEALSCLERWRHLYDEAGDRISLLRRDWLEGSIAGELGRLHQAERFLRRAQRGFVAVGYGYDTALVSLELSAVLLRQNRGPEVRRLVREMLPVFQSRDLHEEAAAALIVFCKAAKQERLTLALVAEVSDFLERSRDDTNLRFRRGAEA